MTAKETRPVCPSADNQSQQPEVAGVARILHPTGCEFGRNRRQSGLDQGQDRLYQLLTSSG